MTVLKTRTLLVAGLLILAVLAPVAWHLLSPLFMNETVAEGFSGAGTVVTQGQFTDGDSFHKGEGTAKLYKLNDGTHLLRFEGFRVTNGPQLHVFVAEQPEPKAGGYVDLGKLKGNIGDQNYEVPRDLDLGVYRTVVIYCVPFTTVFSTAALQ